MFQPKILTTLKHYSKQQFYSDVLAGVIVGIVALPLAIAFGIASGVSPEKGLVTAVVAGFLISALGGSRVQIGGPTGAFVVIVYGIVEKHGIQGLILSTIMAGIILVLMGLARLGTVIKFVPRPVVVGFTSGIAVIIFSSQIKDFFGLPLEKIPAEFLAKWTVIFHHIQSVNFYAMGLALGTVILVFSWPRISRKVPGSLVAIVLGAFLAHAFAWPVETIGSRFGHLPHSIPFPKLPLFNFDTLQQLIQPAMTIALLGAIESLLSAVVADGMIGSRHRSNMELVAQGTANIFSGLFGGIPATGAIARTATNVKNGGRTPVAGLIHALTLFLILIVFGRWAEKIPLACLSGILVTVAYHMSEWRSFRTILKGQRGSMGVLLITFFLTVFIDLTVAIEVGMVLSAFLFMHRMAEATQIRLIQKETLEHRSDDRDVRQTLNVPDGIEIYEISGPLFFGVSHEFEETMRVISKKPKVRILRLRHVPMIDATALHSLEQFHERCRQNHVKLVIAGVHSQPLAVIKRSGLYEAIGEDNFVSGSLDHAITRAKQLMEGGESATKVKQ